MVIWGLRAQPSKATGQTPFFLVYSSEAILPVDIMWKSPHLDMYDTVEAVGSHQLELDSLDEMRCNALLWSTRYLQNMRWYHDRNIQTRSFNMGDMVLRRIQYETGLHKLNSRWEGPFIVTKVTGQASYQLIYPDGLKVPNSWNIEHLRMFYP